MGARPIIEPNGHRNPDFPNFEKTNWVQKTWMKFNQLDLAHFVLKNLQV